MTGAGDLYEEIGRSYSSTRREDPRIAAHVLDAIGDAETIVNVGAGTGSYEPARRKVVAVEPSTQMVRQRRGRSGLVVRAVAEGLPLASRSFDVAMAVLTAHHWNDLAGGLRELHRVARRQVVFYFEPLHTHRFWALDYFPEALTVASESGAPGEQEIRQELDVREVRPVPVPRDCVDGFGAAFWARPDAYADPTVQAGMSWLAQLPREARERGAARLLSDLASGEWHRRHGHLRDLTELDAGYRIAIAGD
jgi:SAM-dependent methyltransferase